MKARFYLWIVWVVLAFSTHVRAEPAADPVVGSYLAEEGDHRIELFLRGAALCGRITWTREPGRKDRNHPDPKVRDRAVVGLEHLHGLVRERYGSWSGGTLYNPEDGRTYDAKLWRKGDGRLIIQGRPRVALLGALLGRLFGRIAYVKEGSR
jgi:uncharacterized protein (DUF2147 family)